MVKGFNARLLSLIALIFLVAGCSIQTNHANIPLSSYGEDTEYSIKERDDGFGISVYYSRYQLIAYPKSVTAACKSDLTAIAQEHSEQTGKPIEPVDQQRIRTSIGRNSLLGQTSCQATAVVKWK